MKLIVGLGNPGRQYEQTRHNVGFQVVDYLSDTWGIPLKETKFKGLFGKGLVNGEKVMLLKPLTFMNLSGEAVAPLMNYFDVDLEDVLVIYDELDLPVGKIRLRYKGSAGGHNGLRSIIQHAGTQEIKRIRVGIDRPVHGGAVTNYVLGNFPSEDRQIINETIGQICEACEMWLEKPFTDVMNRYNSK